MKRFLTLILFSVSLIMSAQVTNTQLKATIDANITNRTSTNKITPALHGATEKAIVDYVDQQDATKAAIASPTLTGDPKAPTPALTDNDTSLATTAYVQGQKTYKVYTAVISQDGTSDPEVLYVLENTLGGDVTFSRESLGNYKANLPISAAYARGCFLVLGYSNSSHRISSVANTGNLFYFSSQNSSNNSADGVISYDTIQIRVYN